MGDNILLAFIVTLFAGLSTGIGSVISLVAKKTNTKLLAVSLGFSAGVMLYVSFVEIFAKGRDALIGYFGEVSGQWLAVGGFFAGIILIGIIDHLIPSDRNPHEMHGIEEMDGESEEHKKSLMRMGVFTALAIAIHNFPEGLATFAATVNDPSLGIPVAVAIAIHNIPEGIAVAVPIYYATNDRKKAFRYSFLSGLSEPIGAIIGYFLLRTVFNDGTFGFVFAAVAGIMVYISLDELLPAAREYGEAHLSMFGLFVGMAVMALSLLLFV